MPSRGWRGGHGFLMAAALCVGTICGFAEPASASVELAAGIADELDGRSTRLYSLMWLSDHQHPWELGATFIEGRGQDAPPFTSDRGVVSVGRRFIRGRFYVLSGLAYAARDDEVLSGYFQFQTGLGVELGQRWSLSLRHLSNASTSGRNRGETFLLAAFRW